MSAPTPYRVRVEVGSHVYDVTSGEAPDYGIRLPLTIGWDVPLNVDYFPAQPSAVSGSFGLVVESVDDVSDIAVGDIVRIEMWLDLTPGANAWQSYLGAVTQVDAALDQAAAVDPTIAPRHVVTVYYSDPLWLLADKVVGLVDWPIESALTRIGRICDEVGIDLDTATLSSAGTGSMPARTAGATDALSQLRACLRDAADRNDSYGGVVKVYGRPVMAYHPLDGVLLLRIFERRVTAWPAELGSDGSLHLRTGEPGALDGGATGVDGRWSRVKPDRYTYVIVDTYTAGNPAAAGAIPLVRRTGYVDVFPDNSGTAAARQDLAEAILPDPDSAAGITWRTDSLRHYSYLDPDPVAGMLGLRFNDDDDGPLIYGYGILRHIFVEVDPRLTLDGRAWIAGTLTGARLTIPAGGKFYIDLTLRPDLYDILGGSVPHTGAVTYDDVPPALTYDDVDPLLMFRDLRLIGD